MKGELEQLSSKLIEKNEHIERINNVLQAETKEKQMALENTQKQLEETLEKANLDLEKYLVYFDPNFTGGGGQICFCSTV